MVPREENTGGEWGWAARLCHFTCQGRDAGGLTWEGGTADEEGTGNAPLIGRLGKCPDGACNLGVRWVGEDSRVMAYVGR